MNRHPTEPEVAQVMRDLRLDYLQAYRHIQCRQIVMERAEEMRREQYQRALERLRKSEGGDADRR